MWVLEAPEGLPHPPALLPSDAGEGRGEAAAASCSAPSPPKIGPPLRNASGDFSSHLDQLVPSPWTSLPPSFP